MRLGLGCGLILHCIIIGLACDLLIAFFFGLIWFGYGLCEYMVGLGLGWIRLGLVFLHLFLFCRLVFGSSACDLDLYI
jgi:hypothetical protein